MNAAFPSFFRNAINLDTPRTIGNMTFGDASPATPGAWEVYSNDFATNILTLSGGSPTITVNPLGPFDTGIGIIDDALIGTNIVSANGFTKAGAGVPTLGGTLNDNLHGTVTVNAGTLPAVAAGATFDYENLVDAERTQFHLANGTTLEAAAQVGDIAATGAGISIAPGATVTLRKLGDGPVAFAEVGGTGAHGEFAGGRRQRANLAELGGRRRLGGGQHGRHDTRHSVWVPAPQ